MRARNWIVDGSIALLFAAVAFAEAADHIDDGYRGTAPPLVGGACAALGALPLVLRRARPVTALALTTALGALPHLAVGYDPVFLGGLCAVVVAAESVGRRADRPAAAWALLIPVPGLAVLALAIPGFAGDAAVSAGLILAGWTLGVLIRALLQHRSALRGELAARREAEGLTTERAVLDERLRIARDLHDVIAHCVGVMVLQAGAARLRLAADPDGGASDIAAAIATVERVGHEALHDLQRVLGTLRGADDDATIASLDRLVDDVRRAGLDVRMRIDGDPAAVPSGLDRSLYRVVQESLTNALKHGSDHRVEMRLAVSDTRVELEVVNAAAAPHAPALPGGNGQVGMRERIAAFGGALETGLSAGRYRVHAVVPVLESAGEPG